MDIYPEDIHIMRKEGGTKMKKKSYLVYPYIIMEFHIYSNPFILVVLFSFTQKIDGNTSIFYS